MRLKTASALVMAPPTLMSSSISPWIISGALAVSAGILIRPGSRTAKRTVAPLAMVDYSAVVETMAQACEQSRPELAAAFVAAQ
jgi:hypothetical protein